MVHVVETQNPTSLTRDYRQVYSDINCPTLPNFLLRSLIGGHSFHVAFAVVCARIERENGSGSGSGSGNGTLW